MNIAKINPCDIANGTGVRVSVFVSGCRRHCDGCHNEQAWDFGYGEPFTWAKEEYIQALLEPDYIDGITILGGEPFERENIADAHALCKMTKESGKTVWVYTGYTWEEVIRQKAWEIRRAYVDVIVDGPYLAAEKDISLLFRGSRNQRIIDVQESIKTGTAVLWEGDKI